jgi:hypothetical protein
MRIFTFISYNLYQECRLNCSMNTSAESSKFKISPLFLSTCWILFKPVNRGYVRLLSIEHAQSNWVRSIVGVVLNFDLSQIEARQNGTILVKMSLRIVECRFALSSIASHCRLSSVASYCRVLLRIVGCRSVKVRKRSRHFIKYRFVLSCVVSHCQAPYRFVARHGPYFCSPRYSTTRGYNSCPRHFYPPPKRRRGI